MGSYFVFTIAGFLAGETSFESLLARKPGINASPLVNAMFDAMIDIGSSPAPAGKSMSIIILGFSDRDQTPGRSEDERRHTELVNSVERADSFKAWMIAVMAYRLRVTPEQVTYGEHVHYWGDGVGASRLEALPTSEENRQLNRRLEVRVSAYGVDRVSAFNGQFEAI